MWVRGAQSVAQKHFWYHGALFLFFGYCINVTMAAMNLTMYGKLTEEQFEKLESIERDVDRLLAERVGRRAVWVGFGDTAVRLLLAADSSVLCEIPADAVQENNKKALVRLIDSNLKKQPASAPAAPSPPQRPSIKYTGVYLYVDGSDLNAIADNLSKELKAVVGRKSRMRVINHREKRTPDLQPGDLPDWRLGLNIDRTDNLRDDLEKCIATVGALASKYRREFVVGYFNKSSDTSEDLAFIKNKTTAKKALSDICSILGI